MAYASNSDREPSDLELTLPAFPVAPLNIFLTSGYTPGVFDLSWDDPSVMAANSRFQVCGVNIYRSFDSEFGPFERLTEDLVGSNFFRDHTNNEVVFEEKVYDQQWIHRGENVGSNHEPRYVFKTCFYPLVNEASQAIPNYDRDSVIVTVDGVRAQIRSIKGETGEVELETRSFPDVVKQKLFPAVIPTDTSDVRVTYRYNRSLVKTDLGTRVFYRITTVGAPIIPGLSVIRPEDLRETPLERAAVTNSREIEKLDYIWKEGVRRNRWILQQGGERVKVFIRKTVGQTCACYSITHKQPKNDCTVCFGVGIVGGYEGPFDTVIAPDDAERQVVHSEQGFQQQHTYEVWTGPAPLLSQRDFLVKINGERYSIGGVRMPTNRGMVLQQHFNIGYIDEQDIRYKILMNNGRSYVNQASPAALLPAEITSKENIPDERELKGRTATWENITF